MNRYTARELVTFTPEISDGAARLYEALDQYARDSGVCWPRQRTLSERLGWSERKLRNHLKELIAAGLCSCERTSPGGPNRYRLSHAADHRQNPAAPPAESCRTHRQNPAGLLRNNTLIESEEAWRPYEEPETPTPSTVIPLPSDPAICWLCHGRGEVGTGSNRGKCNICTGSGKIKLVKKLA